VPHVCRRDGLASRRRGGSRRDYRPEVTRDELEARAAREIHALFELHDRAWDRLRGDPRFAAIEDRMRAVSLAGEDATTFST
jgi:hypothetical protein